MEPKIVRCVWIALLVWSSLQSEAHGQILCGDCDGTQTLTILDALVGAQHAAGLITLTGAQFIACDNPDGNPQKIVAIDIPAGGPYAVQIWDPPACPHDRWYPQVWFDGPNNDLYIYSSTYSSAPIDWVTRVDLDLPSPIYENMTMGITNPPRRYGAAIGHDRATRTVYMFGGNGTAGGPARDDTSMFCY